MEATRPRAAAVDVKEEEQDVDLGPAPLAPANVQDFLAAGVALGGGGGGEGEEEDEAERAGDWLSPSMPAVPGNEGVNEDNKETEENEGTETVEIHDRGAGEVAELAPISDQSFAALRAIGVQATKVAVEESVSAELSTPAVASSDAAASRSEVVVAESSNKDFPALAQAADDMRDVLLEQATSQCSLFDEATDELTVGQDLRSTDPFFQLVQQYQTCCTMLNVVQSEAAELLAECDQLAASVWTHETTKQTAQGTCADRNVCHAEAESTRSTFSPPAVAELAKRIELYREQANSRNASAEYERTIAKLNVESFIARIFAQHQWNDIFVADDRAYLVPLDEDIWSSVRLVDILFYFERRRVHELMRSGMEAQEQPPPIQQFTVDVRRWILHISAILLRCCDLLDEREGKLSDVGFEIRLRLVQHAIRCPLIHTWEGEDLVRFPAKHFDTPQFAWFARTILSPLVCKVQRGQKWGLPGDTETPAVPESLVQGNFDNRDLSDGKAEEPDWVVVDASEGPSTQAASQHRYLLTEDDFAALVDRIPRICVSTAGTQNTEIVWLNVQCLVHTSLSALTTLQPLAYLTRVLAKLCVNIMSSNFVALPDSFERGAEALCSHAWKTMLSFPFLWAFASELPVRILGNEARWRALSFALTAQADSSGTASGGMVSTPVECSTVDEWYQWFFSPGNAVLLNLKGTSPIGAVKSLAELSVQSATSAELLLGACVELCVSSMPGGQDSPTGRNFFAEVVLSNLTCLGFLMPHCNYVRHPLNPKEQIDRLKREFQAQQAQNVSEGNRRASVLKCVSPLIERLCEGISLLESKQRGRRPNGMPGINTGTIIGFAVSIFHSNLFVFGKLGLAYLRLLPLQLYQIDCVDVSEVIRSWLKGLPNHPQHTAARYLFSRLNYDDGEDGELFLDARVHLQIACELAVVYFTKHMEPGVFGFTENQQQFSGWMWSILMSLKHYRLGEALCESLDLDAPVEWSKTICQMLEQYAASGSASQPGDPVATFLILQFSVRGTQLLTHMQAASAFRHLVGSNFDVPALRVLYDCLPSSVEEAGGAKAIAGLAIESAGAATKLFVDSIWLLAAQSSRLAHSSGDAPASSTLSLATNEIAARSTSKRKGLFAAFSGLLSGWFASDKQATPEIAMQLSSMCHVQMSELGLSDLEMVWLWTCVCRPRWWRHQGLCFIINGVLQQLHAPPPRFFRELLRVHWDSVAEDSRRDHTKAQKARGGHDILWMGGLWNDAAAAGVDFLPELPWLAFELMLAKDRSQFSARNVQQFELSIADAASSGLRTGPPGSDVSAAAAFLAKYGDNLQTGDMPQISWLECSLRLSPWEPAFVLYWQQFFRHFFRSLPLTSDPGGPRLLVGGLLATYSQRADSTENCIDRGVRHLAKFISRLEAQDADESVQNDRHPMLLPVMIAMRRCLQDVVLDAITQSSAAEASSPYVAYADSSVKLESFMGSNLAEDELEWLLSLASGQKAGEVDFEEVPEWRQLVPLQLDMEQVSVWQGRQSKPIDHVAALNPRVPSSAVEMKPAPVPRQPRITVETQRADDSSSIARLVDQIERDVLVVVGASDEFSSRISQHFQLDNLYLQMLPHLFFTQTSTVHQQVECRQRNSRCRGKATFIFQVSESIEVARVAQDVAVNRASVASLLAVPIVSSELCTSLLRIRSAIDALYESADTHSSSPLFRESVTTCCAMFHKMLAVRRSPLIATFPATVSFFTEILRMLGHKFVRESADQQVPLLEAILELIGRLGDAGPLAPDEELLDLLLDAWNPGAAVTHDYATAMPMFKSLMSAFATAQQRAVLSPASMSRLAELIGRLDIGLWVRHFPDGLATIECRDIDWVLCVSLNALSPGSRLDKSVDGVHAAIAKVIIEPICVRFLLCDTAFLLDRIYASSREGLLAPYAWQSLRVATEQLMESDAMPLETVKMMIASLSKFNLSVRESCGSLYSQSGLLRFAEESFRLYRVLLMTLERASAGIYRTVSPSDRQEQLEDGFAGLFGPWLVFEMEANGDLATPWPEEYQLPPGVDDDDDAGFGVSGVIQQCLHSVFIHWQNLAEPAALWSFLLQHWFLHLEESPDPDDVLDRLTRLFPGPVAKLLLDEASAVPVPIRLDELTLPGVTKFLNLLTLAKDALRSRPSPALTVLFSLCHMMTELLSSRCQWTAPMGINTGEFGIEASAEHQWLQCVTWCIRFSQTEPTLENSRRVSESMAARFTDSTDLPDAQANGRLVCEKLVSAATSGLTAEHFSSVLSAIPPIYRDDDPESPSPVSHDKNTANSAVDPRDKLVFLLRVLDDIATKCDDTTGASSSCASTVIEFGARQFSTNKACADARRLVFFFSLALRRAASLLEAARDPATVFAELCDVFNHDSHDAETTETLLRTFVYCIDSSLDTLQDESLALKLLESVGERVLNMTVMAQLSEASIDWYLTVHHRSPGCFDWSPLVAALSIPELAEEDFLLGSGCLANGCVITFLLSSLNNLAKFPGSAQVRGQMLQFCNTLNIHVLVHRKQSDSSKLAVSCEGKLILLWVKVVELICAASYESDNFNTGELAQFADVIFQVWGSHKLLPVETVSIGSILSALGINKFSEDSPFSPGFRVFARLFSAYLVCQITPNGRAVRNTPESPPGPLSGRKFNLMVQNAGSVEHWRGIDPSCVSGTLPDVIRAASSFTQDRRNTLGHTERLAASICQDLFPALSPFLSFS